MRSAMKQLKSRVLAPRVDPLAARLGNDLLVSIDPARIALYGESPAESKKEGNKYLYAFYKSRSRFILPGRWDLGCVPFRELERYHFFADLKRHGFDYTKSGRFRELIESVRRGEVVRYKNKGVMFRTEEDVHSYLQGHVEVCKSMIEFGYLPEKASDHICIMVGRNGDLIKEVRGRHRLAIAQVFGVKRIVALIRHVHPIWVRRQVVRFGPLPVHEVLKRAFRELEWKNDHPDLRLNRQSEAATCE